MDDFGSIIYVLLTIVAVIFSIVKKANKSKQTTPPSAESTDPFDEMLPSFEDMFDNTNGGKSVDESSQTPRIAQSTIEPVSVMSDFQERVKKSESMMSRISKSNSSTVSVERLDKEKPWFNARDAVIYSEILKRPKFDL